MQKAELIELLEKQPIRTRQTTFQLVTDATLEDYLTRVVCQVNVKEPEFAELFKEKCKESLVDGDDIAFLICLTDRGECIGHFELKSLDTAPEIGIDLLAEYQRQGFGLEVCQAAVDYLFANTDITLLQYNCFRNNAASLRLAEKLGAVRVGERVMFAKLQAEDLPQSVIDESVGFDVILHEIKKPCVAV